ncbi:uncharacterized protein LOC117649895 [Thrips palmi]|uniref:Uncharacterized protein LOC117649895 n=1 Tax=Thrips palmi TaxID=161013 RepID=A0A6P8ZV40_THRPL|nr:uncharacterized protein LOC117649895 [Thrips palmi]
MPFFYFCSFSGNPSAPSKEKEGESFSCQFCSKVLGHKKNLQRHVRASHNDNITISQHQNIDNGNFVCPACDVASSSYIGLISHLEEHHDYLSGVLKLFPITAEVDSPPRDDMEAIIKTAANMSDKDNFKVPDEVFTRIETMWRSEAANAFIDMVAQKMVLENKP